MAVAFGRGGYFDAARLRAGIAACLLAALAAALSPLPRTRSARVAIGGLAALTAWSALSLTWAPLAGPAVDDIERNVLYLAALVAAATLLTERWTEPALLAGITVTARLRPVRAAAAGPDRARTLGRGRRPPRAAVDVLERAGRAGAMGLVLAAA